MMEPDIEVCFYGLGLQHMSAVNIHGKSIPQGSYTRTFLGPIIYSLV